MSWLRKAPEHRSVTLEDIIGPTQARGAVNWSGVAVTPRTALQHPAVYRSRELICGKLAAFPWTAKRKLSDGSVQDLTTQPSLLLKPSGVVNLRTWKWQVVESLVFDGNAVGRIVRFDERQHPLQIELAPMAAVNVRYRKGDWDWMIDGKPVDRDEIWHVAHDPPPGHILGRSLLEHAANSIATGIASGKFAAQFYGDGGSPNMVMRNTAKRLTRGDMSEVKEAVKAVLGRREPLVIGSDWEAKPWSTSPVEAQLVQVWARNTTDVANYFGVPPEYLGGSGTPMTYSNLGARRQDLVALCLSIWGDPIEAGLTDALPRPVYVRIDYEEFLRGDLATIATIDDKDLRAGVRTPNEVRRTRGLPRMDGGDELVWPPGSTTDDDPAPAPPAPAPAAQEE